MVKLRLVPPLGKPIEIDKDVALIGRELTCDVVLNDGSVSRRHAKIERIEGVYKITDQGSANGTFLDSQRITGSFLKNGQELRLGGMVYRVEVEDPSSPDLTATVAAPSASPDRTVAAPAPVRPPSPPPPASPPPPPPAAAAPPPPPPPVRPPAPPPRPTGGASPPPPPRPAAPRGVPPVLAGPAPGPVRQGKGPLFWILTGCCGCLLLCLFLMVLAGGGLYLTTKAPTDAAHQVLSQIGQGDADAVYNDLDESMRAAMTADDFKTMIQANPALAEFQDVTFWKRSVTNNRATLSGTVTTRSGGSVPITIELVRNDGQWKVTSIVFRSTGFF